MLKKIFEEEIIEKLSPGQISDSGAQTINVYKIILDSKSDYDIVCEFGSESAKIKALLKDEDREQDFWEMSFSIADYRNPEYFHEHFIGVAKKLVFTNSRIILSKGFIFVQFQAYSILSENKVEKIFSFYKPRWKCKLPFLSAKSASYDGIAFKIGETN